MINNSQFGTKMEEEIQKGYFHYFLKRKFKDIRIGKNLLLYHRHLLCTKELEFPNMLHRKKNFYAICSNIYLQFRRCPIDKKSLGGRRDVQEKLYLGI